MKKKMMCSIVVAFALIFSLSNLTLAADKPIKIKLAHVAAPKTFDSAIHASAVAFKYILEKRSGGRFEVEIYPAMSLGKEIDTMEALKNNVIQMNLAAMAALFRINLPITVFFSPYLFKNEEIATEVTEGPFGQKLLDQFTKKTGIEALGYMSGYTYMAITNNKRPIMTPADMKRLKFRVMDPMGIAMFKSFGATAVPLSFKELFTSLQTGVVDGQTNPPFIVAWAKFNECQKYLTMAKSQWGYQVMLANKQWFGGLAPEDQKLVKRALKLGFAASGGLSLFLEDKSLNALTKAGMEVNTIAEKDLGQFAKIARPAGLAWAKEKMGAELVDGLIKAIADAEKKLGYR